MKIIIGNQTPILGECVHYSLQDSFIDKYTSGNTVGSFDITPQQTVRWKLTNNEGFRLYKDEGTFTFNQPAMGKTYLLEAEYTATSGAKETASLIIKPLAGKPKIQRVYWTDTDHQLIGNRNVGYLDTVKLHIETLNIPQGEQLQITVWEDQYAKGHGPTSRNMGTYTTRVNRYGKTVLVFQNIAIYQKKLNAIDFLKEAVHEYYVQIQYAGILNSIQDQTSIKITNKLTRYIAPNYGNSPVTTGGIPNNNPNDDKKKNYTFGVFIDGTLNNQYNTLARQAWEQKTGKKATHKKDLGDEKKYRYNQGSYENDLSNPAILFQYYQEDPHNKIHPKYKIYTEGMGTNTLADMEGNVREEDYKKDDLFLGSGLGMGNAGILARVKRAIEQLTHKIEEEETFDTLTLDVFGFSRGAAAARNFVHEITLPAQPARMTPPIQPHRGTIALVYNKTTGTTYKNHNDYFVAAYYVVEHKGMLPAHGWLGYLLAQKQVVFKRLVVRFVGLYDTVPHYGVLQSDDIRTLGLNAIDKAQSVLHITARDEHRMNFNLARIPVKKDHIELNFPGVHSDIGGGYVEGAPETAAIMQSFLQSLLQSEKKQLVAEGWYLPEQIRFDSKIIKKDELIFILIGTRNYLSNQYSFIPLYTMLDFAETKGLVFKKTNMKKDFNFTSNSIPDNIQFLQQIQSQLKKYTEAAIISPNHSISYEIPEPELKKLRNHYLHYNAVIGLINQPEKGRKRTEIPF